MLADATRLRQALLNLLTNAINFSEKGDIIVSARLEREQVVISVQDEGVGMTPDQIKAAYPFYAVDDLLLGSINTVDEGYFDGITLFDQFRRQVR